MQVRDLEASLNIKSSHLTSDLDFKVTQGRSLVLCVMTFGNLLHIFIKNHPSETQVMAQVLI